MCIVFSKVYTLPLQILIEKGFFAKAYLLLIAYYPATNEK